MVSDQFSGRQLLARSRPIVLRIAFVSLILNLLLLTSPLYMIQVYDRVLSSRSIETLIILTLMMAFAFALYGVLYALRDHLLNRWGIWVVGFHSENAFKRDLQASLESGRASTQSEKDLAKLGNFVSGPLKQLIDVPFAPIFMMVAFLIHPLFFVLGIVTILLMAFTTYLRRINFNKIAARRPLDHMVADTLRAESLKFGALVRMLGMQDNVARSIFARKNIGMEHMLHARDQNGSFDGVDHWIKMTSQSMAIGLAAYLVILGELSPALLLAASIVHGKSISPFAVLFKSSKNISEIRGLLERLDEISDAEQAEEPPKNSYHRGGEQISLSAIDLSLKAPNEIEYLIANISFDAAPGSLTLVTYNGQPAPMVLLQVVAGFLEPDNGHVLWRGQSVSRLGRASLGLHVGYVSNSAQFLIGSIRDNISRFDPDATDARVEQAAADAGCLDLIKRLPHGFDTKLVNSGVALPDVMLHAIAWARALYVQPDFLIIDRSPLIENPHFSEFFLNSLRAAKERGAVIIVHGKPSDYMQLADTVLLVENGKLTKNQTIKQFLTAHTLALLAREDDDFDDDDVDDAYEDDAFYDDDFPDEDAEIIADESIVHDIDDKGSAR